MIEKLKRVYGVKWVPIPNSGLLNILPYYPHSPLELTKKRILISGMPRCGSTFIWQTIGEIIKIENINVELGRAHGGLKNLKYDIVFLTCRDIFDVVKSLTITNEKSVKGILSSEFFNEYMYEFTQEYKQGVLVKYEKYLPHDPEGVVSYVSNLCFGDLVKKETIGLVCDKFSIQNNERISKNYENFSEWDTDTMIHGNHITSNGIGLKKNLTMSEQKSISRHPLVVEYVKIFNNDKLFN